MDRQQDEKEDSGIEQDNQWVFVRVSLEDLQLQVCCNNEIEWHE